MPIRGRARRPHSTGRCAVRGRAGGRAEVAAEAPGRLLAASRASVGVSPPTPPGVVHGACGAAGAGAGRAQIAGRVGEVPG